MFDCRRKQVTGGRDGIAWIVAGASSENVKEDEHSRVSCIFGSRLWIWAPILGLGFHWVPILEIRLCPGAVLVGLWTIIFLDLDL